MSTDNKITSKTKDGRTITIEIDDSGEEINIIDAQGKEIGSIHLTLIDCYPDEHFKITWMYLDKQGESYLHQGIGRRALQFHKERFDAPIASSDNDGIVKSDGSHLTGDAPAFIHKMRTEGIVRPSSFDYGTEDDE